MKCTYILLLPVLVGCISPNITIDVQDTGAPAVIDTAEVDDPVETDEPDDKPAVLFETTEGDCDLKAPIIEAFSAHIDSKRDSNLHPLILNNHQAIKTRSVGVSFFGSKALSSALEGNAEDAVLNLAQSFFPSVAHLHRLIKDRETADKFVDSIKLAWSAYKTAQGLEAAGSVSQYLQGQIHQRWSIHCTRSRQSQDWEDAALPSLRVVEFKDEAGRDACLEGVGFGASTKTVQVGSSTRPCMV